MMKLEQFKEVDLLFMSRQLEKYEQTYETHRKWEERRRIAHELEKAGCHYGIINEATYFLPVGELVLSPILPIKEPLKELIKERRDLL